MAVEPPVSVESPAVVTIAPPPVGGEVVEGDVVVEVSGRPVFVLEGTAPMYRSLRPGMSGADVVQLQVALARLGYEPDADGVFGEATKASCWWSLPRDRLRSTERRELRPGGAVQGDRRVRPAR